MTTQLEFLQRKLAGFKAEPKSEDNDKIINQIEEEIKAIQKRRYLNTKLKGYRLKEGLSPFVKQELVKGYSIYHPKRITITANAPYLQFSVEDGKQVLRSNVNGEIVFIDGEYPGLYGDNLRFWMSQYPRWTREEVEEFLRILIH